jgi:hypothetical protein
MKKRELTVEEIVSLLRHSSVPTILVEGSEDIMVYRWLKQHIKPLKASAIQCGGREKLLSVYKRRNEFYHLKTAFLADQDMYVFLGIPSDYSDIIWTAGYSIENDIYAGSTKLDDLLDEEERDDYNQLLEKIIEWFAFEVEEYKKGKMGSKIDIVILHNQPISENETYISIQYENSYAKTNLILRKDFNLPDQNLLSEMKNDFKLKLRGKILFKVLSVYLNARKRVVKYKSEALYEIGAKPVNKHPYMKRLILEINQKLGNQK